MAFPPPHTIEPKASHTHTAILLHGRSSDGEEFAEDLFSSNSSNNQNLAAHFPTWRWVFPTSRVRWSSVFKEDLSAWFDAYSLADPCEQQDLQAEGLRGSVLHVLEVLRREVELLHGDGGRVVLGGMSQGMATAVWALLCSPGRVGGGIGGFVGFCGWIPFGDGVEDLLRRKQEQEQEQKQQVGGGESGAVQGDGLDTTMKTVQCIPGIIGLQDVQASKADIEAMLSVPVLQLHGSDDVWIDVELGRQVYRILGQLGLRRVDWKEYVGAENEGHWVKEPEGFDMIVSFLKNVLGDGKE